MEHSVKSFPLLSFRSVRLYIGILMLAALCIEGLMRSNLNMAMVCMVNRTAITRLENFGDVVRDYKSLTTWSASLFSDKERLDDCDVIPKKVERSYNGKFIWSPKEQGWIFAAYYIGTLLIVIPGTYLIDAYGATLVVQVGAVINVIGTFLTPVISEYLGPHALLFIRFFMGAGQGILQPCTSVLIAHWFPPEEKSFAVGISTAGNQALSIIIAMVFTAGLCQVPILDGWPTAFYLHGFIGLIFCVLWYFYAKDVPTRYKGISDAELSFITGGIGERGQKRLPPFADRIIPSIAFYQAFMPVLLLKGTLVSCELSLNIFPATKTFLFIGAFFYICLAGIFCQSKGYCNPEQDVPWKSILLSLSVWATALSSFSQSFATVGMVTYIPLYYRVVLRMDLTANGILSAAPFLSQLLSKVIFVYSAAIASNYGFGLTAITKACNLTAAFGAAACYVCLLFLDCHHNWTAVMMVCLAMAILSGYVPGYQTGIVSIAPKYTCAIASFCRLLGNIASVASPALIGWIVKKGSLDEWRIVFVVMTITLLLTGAFYQLCGSADIEPWAQHAGKDDSVQKLVPKKEGS